MDGSIPFFSFVHSLLRYGVILFLLISLVISWRGYLTGRPILVGERTVVIITVLLCHIQLVLGAIMYMMRYKAFDVMYAEGSAHLRYWKYEHIGTMIIAIVLVTIGRVLSKRARTEARKHLYVGIFFLIGLLLILWATPWPFTAMGYSLGWI